jgi:hypothetical protein
LSAWLLRREVTRAVVKDYLGWATAEGHTHRVTLTTSDSAQSGSGGKRVQITGGERVYKRIRLKLGAEVYPIPTPRHPIGRDCDSQPSVTE